MVMHDLYEDIYYEVQFHSWTTGGMGGGFSYTRTRDIYRQTTDTVSYTHLTLPTKRIV